VLGSLVRRLALGGASATLVWFAWGYGRTPGALTLVGVLAVVAAVAFWLPRAAHAAFERGQKERAALLYGGLRWLLLDPSARASALLSRAACALVGASPALALPSLHRVPVARLGEAARSAWLNNVAYALARGGDEVAEALARVDEALALRPSVPGFRHTRGITLLALGRVDEAIRELEAVRQTPGGKEIAPLLEAERCYDLGVAWQRKGERDYARDYFARAQRAAPESPWAELAARELGDRAVPTGVALPEPT
jgi:tetratricopeptide (TPR) repeat protein